jgi:hypothetical protein
MTYTAYAEGPDGEFYPITGTTCLSKKEALKRARLMFPEKAPEGTTRQPPKVEVYSDEPPKK